VIEGLDWQPPDQTTPVDTPSPDRLLIQANSVHHNWFAWVADQPAKPGDPYPNLIGYNTDVWNGDSAPYTLTMRSWLVLVPNSYTQVSNPNSTTRTASATYGVSQSDTTTISTELGVEAEGLSAKLQASFSQTVTTSTETTETIERKVEAPSGMTRVWMLWQVMNELAALDQNGKVMGIPTRRGWANFVDEGPDDAFLTYASTQQLFPSKYVLVGVKDFPTAT